MHLFSTIATAAVVSTAVAANVPAGTNYTFSGHAATTSKPQTLIGTAASQAVAPTGTAVSAQGTAMTAAKMQALLKLSQSFEFEVRGGLCAIKDMPAEAAAFSWRLVYDIDLESKFRFEICEAQDQGRVVTKVQGQYLYGLAVSYDETVEGAVEVVCDNGSLNHYKIENEKIVETEKVVVKETIVKVYECANVDKCAKSSCNGDECHKKLVAKVEAPVYVNTTAPAAPKAPVSYKFEECKVEKEDECACVQTCVEDKCKVEKPSAGPAPAPVSADKVQPKVPVAPTQAAKESQKPVASPKPAVNGTAAPVSPKPATAGSGRVVVALNVLAGLVATALFL